MFINYIEQLKNKPNILMYTIGTYFLFKIYGYIIYMYCVLVVSQYNLYCSFKMFKQKP